MMLLALVALPPVLAADEDVGSMGASEAASVQTNASAADVAPTLTNAGTSGAEQTAGTRARPAFGSKLAWSLYEQAGARHGLSPAMLNALHAVESSAAGDGCIANLEGSGATGPFQFMPATFRAYGVDASEDGRADACNVVDALFSAARYLELLGADADPSSTRTLRALRRYGTDADRVVTLALMV